MQKVKKPNLPEGLFFPAQQTNADETKAIDIDFAAGCGELGFLRWSASKLLPPGA